MTLVALWKTKGTHRRADQFDRAEDQSARAQRDDRSRARRGAGAGFAVVASEVKSLARDTQRTTDEIANRIDNLQNDTSRLISAVDIGMFIDGLWPVISAIAGVVEVQTRSTAELSSSTGETSGFIARVNEHANAMVSVTTATAKTSADTEKSVRHIFKDAEKLRSRFVVFLWETEVGSRRREDRLPCDRP